MVRRKKKNQKIPKPLQNILILLKLIGKHHRSGLTTSEVVGPEPEIAMAPIGAIGPGRIGVIAEKNLSQKKNSPNFIFFFFKII